MIILMLGTLMFVLLVSLASAATATTNNSNSTATTTIAATANINVFSALRAVDERFVSYTLDSSFWREIDLTNPILRFLARQLSPAVLRVGGTQADYDVWIGEDGTFSCENPPPPMTSYRCRTINAAQWRGLVAFAREVKADLVFGLNDMFGRPTKTSKDEPLCGGGHKDKDVCPPRNQTNIKQFLQWNVENDIEVHGFELGNELNNCLNGAAGAYTQADDLRALRDLITKLYPAARGSPSRSPSTRSRIVPPLVIGPDTHSSSEFSRRGLHWLHAFAKALSGGGRKDQPRPLSPTIDVWTFHEYSMGKGRDLNLFRLNASFLNASALDKSGAGVKAVLDILSSHMYAEGYSVKPALWAGETASANGGGQSGVTDTYIDGFWYLDQLGSHAQQGVDVVCRQTLQRSGGYPLVDNYQPLPDYWVALLWTRLMGTRVLDVGGVSDQGIRVYAHCAKGRGGVAIAWLNIKESESPTTLRLNELVKGGDRPLNASGAEIWVLAPGEAIDGAVNPLQSRQAWLNGKVLSVVDGPALPPLDGVKVTASSGELVLPASRYGFAVLPYATVRACT